VVNGLIHLIYYGKIPDPYLHFFAEMKFNDKWVSMDATFDSTLHKAVFKGASILHAVLKSNPSLMNCF